MGLVILLLAAILVTLLGAWPILFGLMALAIAGWLIYLVLLVIQGIPASLQSTPQTIRISLKSWSWFDRIMLAVVLVSISLFCYGMLIGALPLR